MERIFQAVTSKWSRPLCDTLSCVFCSVVKLLWSASQALPCSRQVGALRPHHFCLPRNCLLVLLMSDLAFSFLLRCSFHSQKPFSSLSGYSYMVLFQICSAREGQKQHLAGCFVVGITWASLSGVSSWELLLGRKWHEKPCRSVRIGLQWSECSRSITWVGSVFLCFSTMLGAKPEEDCCAGVKELECILQLRWMQFSETDRHQTE